MAKILVVDDEPRCRDLIGHILTADGHETRTAASGREALDRGPRYRPDVLVTDWMLKDDIHGLHVVRVLRAVLPGLRAVMMTGFSTGDLRKGADEAGVCAFLEKPFDAERVRAAVREVTSLEKTGLPQVSLAMMELDSAGSIVFANAAALAMMDETTAGREARDFAALLSDEATAALPAVDRWVVVLPRGEGQKRWHLRSQEPHEDGSRLVVLRRGDEPRHLGLALVGMLLGVRDVQYTHWPFDERVLIVDEEAMLRTLCVSMMENAGAGCYAAETAADALRLLQHDHELRFVVLSFEMPNTDTRSLVEMIRAARPDITIVGTGDGGHCEDFASMGVEHYLERPWRADALINTLTGRIGTCASCDLPLPLRRPKPGESATSWECANCGGRYRAILDQDCPEDTFRNARQV